MRKTLQDNDPLAAGDSQLKRRLENGLEELPRQDQAVAILRLWWTKRDWLLRITAIGLAISIVLAFVIPKRYESFARLMPPESPTSSLALLAASAARPGGNLSGNLGAMAGDVLGIKSSGALFVGVLQSRTVQDRLIDRFKLKERYWVSRIEDAREKLTDRTNIIEDRKSGIVTLVVTDSDPHVARDMAQAYVEELNRVVTEVTTSSARRERIFIEERLKVVKVELDQSAQEFSQFASKNSTLDIKEQGKAMVEAAATLQGQLIVAQTELEGLKQVYTEGNIRLRASRARIAELRSQLDKLGGVGSASEQQDEIYPSIRRLPILGVTYADLFRRTKIAEVVFELLTQQYELAKVQEAKEIPTVRLLDAPVVPEKKSFPPRTALILIGTLLTFGAAAGYLHVRERWRGIDSLNPGKMLAQDVFSSLKSIKFSPRSNGSRTNLGGDPGGQRRAPTTRTESDGSSEGDDVPRFRGN